MRPGEGRSKLVKTLRRDRELYFLLAMSTHSYHPVEAPWPVEDRWRVPEAGMRYAGGRWRNARAAGRDPRLVARALRRQNRNLAGRHILDMPCGAGRLRPGLEATGARWVGVDVSEEMLRAAAGDRVRASGWALPFADGTFEAVVCCRLMHHLPEPEQRAALVAELVRVSRDLILASYWEAASLHAWRRRAGLRRAAHPDTRVALPRRELEAHFAACGAEVVDGVHSLRFVSPQAFLVARKRG